MQAVSSLYDNSIAVVNFVLDYLRRPAGEGFDAGLEVFVLPFHLNGAVALGFAGALQRETALLRLKRVGAFDDSRVKHCHIFAVVVKSNDTLVHTDHIGCQTNTGLGVGFQGVKEVFRNGEILQSSRFAASAKKNYVVNDGFYHKKSSFVLY